MRGAGSSDPPRRRTPVAGTMTTASTASGTATAAVPAPAKHANHAHRGSTGAMLPSQLSVSTRSPSHRQTASGSWSQLQVSPRGGRTGSTGSNIAAAAQSALATPNTTLESELASLRQQLDDARAQRLSLELQIVTLTTTHEQALAAIRAKHTADTAELARSMRQHEEDALSRQDRLHADRMVEDRFQLEAAVSKKLSAASKAALERDRAEWREEVAIMRSQIEAKDQQLHLLRTKHDHQALELHKATYTAHRLQTAIDLFNRQTRHSEDYKTILKHVACKLYVCRYRHYKQTRDLHKSLCDLVRSVSEQEKQVWRDHHEGKFRQDATTTHATARTTTMVPSRPTMGFDRISVLDEAPSRIGGLQNETAEWLQRDRSLWAQEKVMFAQAATARRARCERIEYKLQYQAPQIAISTAAPAAAASSHLAIVNTTAVSEHRRLRNDEKRRRAADEGPEKRTRNLFAMWVTNRHPLITESLPILAIALTESVARERAAFATTQLFQVKNTELLLAVDTLKEEKRAIEARHARAARTIASLRDQLADARDRMCPCAAVAAFTAHDRTADMRHVCLCDCVDECACVAREVRRRENAEATAAGVARPHPPEEKQEARPDQSNSHADAHETETDARAVDSVSEETLPCVPHSSAASKHSSRASSAGLRSAYHAPPTHVPSPPPPHSLSSLTPLFSTALGSGRNARTHAMLDEVSNHATTSAASTSGAATPRLAASASVGNLANSIDTALGEDVVHSVPFLQRTIKSLRARLYAARAAIGALQGEIVTAGFRKAGRDHTEEARQTNHTAEHAHSRALPPPPQQVHAKSGAQTHRPLGRPSSGGGGGDAGFGSRTARFHDSSSTASVTAPSALPAGSTLPSLRPSASTSSAASIATLSRSAVSPRGPLSPTSRADLRARLDGDLEHAWRQSVGIVRQEYHAAAASHTTASPVSPSVHVHAVQTKRAFVVPALQNKPYAVASRRRTRTLAASGKQTTVTPRVHILSALADTQTTSAAQTATQADQPEPDQAASDDARPTRPTIPPNP